MYTDFNKKKKFNANENQFIFLTGKKVAKVINDFIYFFIYF